MEQDFSSQPRRETATLNNTRQERREQELNIAERLRREEYRSPMTIIAEDAIEAIKRAESSGDFERLELAIKKALPITEGLDHGVYAESYGIYERDMDTQGVSNEERKRLQTQENNMYARARNIFLTVEDSTERGNIGYLKDAILDALSSPIRELEDWEEDGGASWTATLEAELRESLDQQNFHRLVKGENVLSRQDINEQIDRIVAFRENAQRERIGLIRKNKERILELEHHAKSRFTFDSAFRQRQYIAHDRELQSNMKKSVGLGAAEPDGTHWQGFYQVDVDWGRAVDMVERELVTMGYEGYFTGNLDSKRFKEWINRALDKSRIGGEGKKRMDVVWAAWKQFCFKELAGKFSMSLDPTDSGHHRIGFGANPPYVGDLSTWLSHPEEHRANEFGWNHETYQAALNPGWDGRVVGERAKSYKSVSHSGHPAGIGHMTSKPSATQGDSLPIARFGSWQVGNLMEFATLRGGPHDGMNLWQIWWEEGVSQADMEFPWIDTDLYAKTGTSDESPSGVVGYWFLQRGRAFWALSQFQGMPDGDMETLAYVTTFRNSDKLGMIKPGKFMENPMFVKIRSDILFHKGISAYAHSDMHEGRPLSELEYSVISTKEQMANLEAGRVMQGIQGMNLRNYIFNALAAGLIDHNEYKTLNNITPKT